MKVLFVLMMMALNLNAFAAGAKDKKEKFAEAFLKSEALSGNLYSKPVVWLGKCLVGEETDYTKDSIMTTLPDPVTPDKTALTYEFGKYDTIVWQSPRGSSNRTEMAPNSREWFIFHARGAAYKNDSFEKTKIAKNKIDLEKKIAAPACYRLREYKNTQGTRSLMLAKSPECKAYTNKEEFLSVTSDVCFYNVEMF